MTDLISRDAAICEMYRLEQEDIETYGAKIPEGFDAEPAVEALKALPSAQQWIPVTERLPEVDENVLVSYHFDGDSEFFPPFDGVTISYWTGVKNHNIPHFADMGDACTILAWMPLPEPYREEDDGRPD